jgi:predicted  nucleic acid-binding Zn-ribbon protein
MIRLYLLSLLLLSLSSMAWAQEVVQNTPERPEAGDTLPTLQKLTRLRATLQAQIKEIERQLRASPSDSEKKELQKDLTQLHEELDSLKENFVEIAAGIGFIAVSSRQEQDFNIQGEMLSLMEPIIREMKYMTSEVRKKSDIREEITFYKTRIPKARTAIANVSALISKAEDKALKEYLQDILDDWKRRLANMESQLQALELQLNRIESAETSFADASHTYLKSFFQKRGLYLTQALLVVFVILVLSRLTHTLMVRLVPGYRLEHRRFNIRLLDLVHRMITIALMIIGPMVVFYVAEDWVLFSLGVLLLLGAAWTLRTAIPRYWQQIRIYLNIGSVREGERIFLEGLPWRVKKIDIFTLLDNPDAGISQRIAIENLVDLKSRPAGADEPWFPCRKDDWVLLSDGVRGKVVGISHELIELVERGGARKTYLTQDFLGQSPRNLSVNFRLKETIGVSYDLQSISTTSMLQILKAHLLKNIEAEGYGPDLLQLNVEFQSANTSSLDLVVLADFKGVQAPLYNRLRRAIQRWCVDACTENNWEIPFTQLTLHNRD